MKHIKVLIILSFCTLLSACVDEKRQIMQSYKTEDVSQEQVLKAFGEPYNKITNKNNIESWYYRKSMPAVTKYYKDGHPFKNRMDLISSDIFTIISFDKDKHMKSYKQSSVNYALPISAHEKHLTGTFDYTEALSAMDNNIEFGTGKTPKTIVIE
ncbi:MAG: hypothetical protein LBH92_03565 [Bacteroidales bacterium]|nr:hypothetical protein [Bacteroidales bacterium]